MQEVEVEEVGGVVPEKLEIFSTPDRLFDFIRYS